MNPEDFKHGGGEPEEEEDDLLHDEEELGSPRTSSGSRSATGKPRIEVAKDLGKRLIGQGREVDMRLGIEDYVRRHRGASLETAQTAHLRRTLDIIDNPDNRTKIIDPNTETFKVFDTQIKLILGKERGSRESLEQIGQELDLDSIDPKYKIHKRPTRDETAKYRRSLLGHLRRFGELAQNKNYKKSPWESTNLSEKYCLSDETVEEVAMDIRRIRIFAHILKTDASLYIGDALDFDNPRVAELLGGIMVCRKNIARIESNYRADVVAQKSREQMKEDGSEALKRLFFGDFIRWGESKDQSAGEFFKALGKTALKWGAVGALAAFHAPLLALAAAAANPDVFKNLPKLLFYTGRHAVKEAKVQHLRTKFSK